MEYNYLKFKNGLKDGIPIALGYLAVSFTFGIAAKNSGLNIFEAITMSASNVTSAGQFAGLGLIKSSALYVEVVITQLIINMRYALMSCAISQKIDLKKSFLHRFLIAFGVTDEIFALSVCGTDKLNPCYTYGLMTISIPAWIIGTFFGVISGNFLPGPILSALNIAIYAMFIAIIVPPSKENKTLGKVIIISMGASFAFDKLPVLSHISPGFKIIILSTFIAGVAALTCSEEGVLNEN